MSIEALAELSNPHALEIVFVNFPIGDTYSYTVNYYNPGQQYGGSVTITSDNDVVDNGDGIPVWPSYLTVTCDGITSNQLSIG